jgi:hypothetical protein
MDTTTKEYQDTILGVMPLQLVSNDKFVCDNGIVKYSGSWEFLGIYLVESDSTITWEWGCNILPDDERCKYVMKQCYDSVQEYKELFDSPIIQSKNKMLVSYLMAILSHVMKYEYMKVQYNNLTFSLFGLKDIVKESNG